MNGQDTKYLKDGIKEIKDTLTSLSHDFTEHRVSESAILARHDQRLTNAEDDIVCIRGKQQDSNRWIKGLLVSMLLLLIGAIAKSALG